MAKMELTTAYSIIPYVKGTIQNLSSINSIEVTEDVTLEGQIVACGQAFSFDGSSTATTLYARSCSGTATIIASPFVCDGGGGEGGGTNPLFLGYISATETAFPTQRPDGSALVLGDYMRPAIGSSFPFTVGTVTFTSEKDTAVYMGSDWILNANAYQKTNETPIAFKSIESINGSGSSASFQDDINAENAVAINAAATSGQFRKNSNSELVMHLWDRQGNNIINATIPNVVFTSDTQTLTNKTINADNNTISDLEVDNFKASTITLSSEGITSASTDNEIPTSKAVYDVIGGRAVTSGTFTKEADGKINLTLKDKDGGEIVNSSIDNVVYVADTQTITNKTINADSNTISDLEVDNFKGTAITTSTEGISSTSTDTEMPTSKAVYSYAKDRINSGSFSKTTDGKINLTLKDSENAEVINSDIEKVVFEDDTQTITNKTINADNNTISDLEVDNFKDTAITLSSEGLSSTSADTELPTSKLLYNELEKKVDHLYTMPTASVQYANNKFYQYIGNTTTDYEHGRFYECVLDSGVYKWKVLAWGGGDTPIFVGTVTNSGSMPTTRPNGDALVIGDYVKPAVTSTFPFSIGSLTFNSVSDTAVFMTTGNWIINASAYQKTTETPIVSRTSESYLGSTSTAVYQSDINAENASAIQGDINSITFAHENTGELKANLVKNDGTTTPITQGDIVFINDTQTLTNKTIDVDNNTVSNIEVDNFKDTAITLSSEGILSTSTDTELPTSKAVYNELDKKVDHVSTMPTASSDYCNGKFYQYIGTTTTDYTHGYFYECIADTTTTPTTYKWQNLEMGGSDWFLITATATTTTAGTFDKTATEIKTALQAGKKLLVSLNAGTDTYDIFTSMLTKYDASDMTLRFYSINEYKVLRIMEWTQLNNAYAIDTFELAEKFQYLAMPTASIDLVDKVYQYIGTTTTEYTQGSFYICVDNSGTYSWQALGSSGEYLPLAGGTMTGTITISSSNSTAIKSASNSSQFVIQGGNISGSSLTLSGTDSSDSGRFRLSAGSHQLVGFTNGRLEWENNPICIQVSTMPTASATLLGRVYQFIGTTTSDYTQGKFYLCIANGSDYEWQLIDTSGSSSTDIVSIVDKTTESYKGTSSTATTQKDINDENADQIKNGLVAYLISSISDDEGKITIKGYANSGGARTTNTIEGLATIEGTQTLTNKTINADNNTISDLEVDNFKDTAITTSTEGISSTSTDTEIPTSKAVYSKVGEYLPLAGGTMTGTITANETIFASRPDNTGYLQISGGSTTFGGATLCLYGADSTNNGQFIIYATGGAGTTIQNLLGKSDGSLKWSGNPICIQRTSMGTASADLVGRVYQYIGTSTIYEQGHFYICVNNSGTYEWKELNVQTGITVLPTRTTPTVSGWYYIQDENSLEAFIV